MTLLDVSIWLAAAWAPHVHHSIAKAWMGAEARTLGVCRVTQMSFLRLISNPGVVGGDARSRREAWLAFDALRSDSRVTYVEEPPGLESVWRALSARDDQIHKLWTDDYLAAFAQTAHLTLVTLDRSFIKRYPSVRVEVL